MGRGCDLRVDGVKPEAGTGWEKVRGAVRRGGLRPTELNAGTKALSHRGHYICYICNKQKRGGNGNRGRAPEWPPPPPPP